MNTTPVIKATNLGAISGSRFRWQLLLKCGHIAIRRKAEQPRNVVCQTCQQST